MKRVSGKQLARILVKKGWTLHHTRGSHHYYLKDGRLVTVPIHSGTSPLKPTTQKSIMKQAGLTEADL